MKITTPAGTLVVNDDTEISLTLTNPFFEEQGSHSLPFSVPYNDHNLKALGNPHRPTNAKKVSRNISGSLEAGSLKTNGVIEVVDVAAGNPVELCIKTREGAFWDWAKNTQLRDINIPHEALDLTMAGFQTIKNNYFNNVWPAVDFAFMPLASNFISLDNYKETANYNLWSDRKLCISDYVLWNNPGDLYRNDSDRTSRLSPFVYVNAVLQWIANSFGHIVGENYLGSTDELKSSVLLNRAYNTDVIGGFLINPDNLLPKVTVMDFITTTETAFNCRLMVDSKSKTINIISRQLNLLSSPVKIHGNLSVVELESAKTLEFAAKQVNSPYASVNKRAIDNFFFTYDTQDAPIIDGKIYHSASSPNYTTHPNKFVFSVALQAYFRFEWTQGSGNWEYKASCMHCNLYERKINPLLESKKVDHEMHFAPMVPVTCRQFYKSGENNAYFDFTLIVPFLGEWDWLFSNEDGILGDNEEDAPIVFAFNRGRIVPISFPVTLFDINSFDLPWGSTDVYDKAGAKIATANIAFRFNGDHNLYDNFYKGTEIFYNNQTARLSITNIDKQEFLSKKIHEVLLVDGVKVVLNNVDLSIIDDNVAINSIEGYALKPQIS